MKNVFRTLFVLAIVFAISSCNKESDLQPTVSDESYALSLLKDVDNPENDQVNQVLYLFAKAVQNAVQDPELLSYMEKALERDVRGFGVSISKLTEENASFADAILPVLESEMKSNGLSHIADGKVGASMISALSDQMICQNKVYEPIIHRVQATSTSSNRNSDVIIAIGEEVTDDDEILAYRNNETEPFLLSEEMAMGLSDNLIIIGVGDIPEGFDTPLVVEEGDGRVDNNVTTSRMNVDFDVDRHQIKRGYRYERSKKSEVKAWYLKFTYPTGSGVWLNNWLDFPHRIHKNDINNSKIFYDDRDAFGMSLSEFNAGTYVFIGAWENDWYASLKVIVNPCLPNNLDVSVGVAMKYSNEWYFYDCEAANVWWPNVNSDEIFSNQKCMFDLKRTM